MASITVGCPVCEDSFELEVEFSPGYPAHISAHPENDYPGEGPSTELLEMIPDACPECKHVWAPEELEEVNEYVDKALESYSPERYENDSGPDTMEEYRGER